MEILFENQEELNIAVAFWGIEAWQLFKNIPSNKKINLICNLESSACNPFLIETLMDIHNIQLRTNRLLHAKVLFQENNAIIGSANISANGLGFEGNELNGWIEAGVQTNDTAAILDLKDWFQKLWDSSDILFYETIEHYKILWQSHRNSRPVNSYQLSLLDAVKYDNDNFADRKIYFAIYRNRNASDEAIEKYESVKEIHYSLPGIIEFYEDWSDIPDNADIISIYFGPRGGLIIDGTYKSPEKALIESFIREDETEGEIKIVFKSNSIHGYKLSKSDKTLIKQNIEKLMSFQPNPHDAFLIPIVDGVTKLNE